MRRNTPLPLALFLSAATVVPIAARADESPLSDVVISAGRSAQRSFDAPAAIQGVTRQTIEEAGPQVNLSESINRIPGAVALDRQNYAQDLQLSIRGFGARSTFGIRGVRLIVDGIPATMPDGQGQASTINLSSAERIEVLRGPLAQLYGNAAGGVVQVFTRTGTAPASGGLSFSSGSLGAQRSDLSAQGRSGNLAWIADASQFWTEGYRRAQRDPPQPVQHQMADRPG
jgi:iron complex outermembrane receptor protein